MNHLDLFSGIGGFALAAKWAGIKTIAFCENDPFCQKVLKKNFPNIHCYDDIRKLQCVADDTIDLITAGFPCQPFSIAGKRKGKNDDRHLWPETERIIHEAKPAWVIIENVTGIVGMELDNILDDLEREGYQTQSFIIPACAANAPHRRDRLWIIANRLIERCDNSLYYRKSRHVQENKEWNLAALQSEWEKLKPESWATMSAEYWLKNNSYFERNDDGISPDVYRIKALGNAIVPQVVYPIMRLIKLLHEEAK